MKKVGGKLLLLELGGYWIQKTVFKKEESKKDLSTKDADDESKYAFPGQA